MGDVVDIRPKIKFADVAQEAGEMFETGLVVGIDKGGDLVVLSRQLNATEVLWLMEQAKLALLSEYDALN